MYKSLFGFFELVHDREIHSTIFRDGFLKVIDVFLVKALDDCDLYA
jgi:hypothetical protein